MSIGPMPEYERVPRRNDNQVESCGGQQTSERDDRKWREQLAAWLAGRQSQRQQAKDCRDRSHQDRNQAFHRTLDNRFSERDPLGIH